jgi:hypothetical protein
MSNKKASESEVTVGVMAVVGAAVIRVSLWLLSWYGAHLVFSWTGVV